MILIRRKFKCNKKTGIKKIPTTVAKVIPPTTALPKDTLAPAPGPVAIAKGTDGILFENNLSVGNKNNLYIVRGRNAVIRNNISYAPEQMHGYQIAPTKGFAMRNEAVESKIGPSENIAVYNNLFVNVPVGFDGGTLHNGERVASGSMHNIYFAHNTIVASPYRAGMPRRLITMNFSTSMPASGVFENNIFNRQKDPLSEITVKKYPPIVFKNNAWPVNAPTTVRSTGDVYDDNNVLVNAVQALPITPPATGAASVDLGVLRSALSLANYKLKNNSPAKDAGVVNPPQFNGIPQDVLNQSRQVDNLGLPRDARPDIGAFELQ